MKFDAQRVNFVTGDNNNGVVVSLEMNERQQKEVVEELCSNWGDQWVLEIMASNTDKQKLITVLKENIL
jgi:hypothetical protein